MICTQIATLAETDPIRARTSKKDNEVRAAEIKRAASEDLLAWIAKSGAEVSQDPGGSLVVLEVMLSAEGGSYSQLQYHAHGLIVLCSLDKTAASETLLKILAAPYPPEDPATPHPISLAHTSRMFKTLLQGGHFSQASKTVQRSPLFSASAFASKFVELVGRDSAVAMARGDGAFVIAALCERVAEEGPDEKATVKSWFGSGVKAEIKKSGARGSAVLLDKVVLLS